MEVAYSMLANYAEDNGGLLYVQGGGWDTTTLAAPIEGAPEGVFTFIKGFFVARLAFHQTETGRDHGFELLIVDADGAEVAQAGGTMRVGKTPGLPTQWHQHVNLVMPLTGIPLPRPGEYRLSLLVDGTHALDLPFRVIKGF